MALIISKTGGSSEKILATNFEDEKELQEYILKNPECIPIYDIEEDTDVLILARESSTESGPIDAVGVDGKGNVYLVEVKLEDNTDKRRIVAQILDYGASLWRNERDFQAFLNRLEQHCHKHFSLSLREKLQEFFELDEAQIEELLDGVRGCVSDARYKFIIVMDQMDSQLKDLILFINQNSKFDLYAVEMEYYKYKDFRITIPRLIGAEGKKDVTVRPSATSSGRRKWDEQSFFEDAAQRVSKDDLAAMRKIFGFTKEHTDIIDWGTGQRNGSFSAKFSAISQKSVYSVYSDGRLSFNFNWLHNSEEAMKCRDALKKALDEIQLDIPDNYQSIRPSLLTKVWVPKIDGIITAIKSVVLS